MIPNAPFALSLLNLIASFLSRVVELFFSPSLPPSLALFARLSSAHTLTIHHPLTSPSTTHTPIVYVLEIIKIIIECRI
jgi:hypothetical protein